MKNSVISVIIISLLVIVGAVYYLQTGKETTSPENNINQEQNAVITTPTESQTHTIKITSSGFSPQALEIKKGDKVEWINEADAESWPASAMHPTHKAYPVNTGKCALIGGSDFDSCKGLKRGESWTFQFNEVGNWNYHDHLQTSHSGTIVVK